MSVLEEEELKIMKQQQKEYEEIRNAELIEAQRLEAKELRLKKEIDQRKVQQRARKEERKAAHKKYISRVMAKKYLLGLRENGFSALKDQGLMVKPMEMVMHEQVMPWLLEKMMGFMEDTDVVDLTMNEVINKGFKKGEEEHKEKVQDEYDRREYVRLDIERKIREKEEAKQKRRNERERRRKLEELKKLKEEIHKLFVSKGDTKDGITSFDLLDIHGNYDKNRGYVGTVGGQFMQIVLVVQALYNEFAQGTNEKAKAFFNKQNLTQYLIQYLKDMKNEFV